MAKRKRGNSRLHSLINKNNLVSCKRSQVTIFIILAIIIVAALLIVFYPRVKKAYFVSATPSEFIEDCLNEHVNEAIAILAKQGGSFKPENTIMYKGEKIEYLCYTTEYYKTCNMQQPMLKQHFEQELVSYLVPIAEECLGQLASDYSKKGYAVERKKSSVSVSIIPESINIRINAPLTLAKETKTSYDKFNIVKNSEMYDMLMISESILNWEARYGDSAPESYMLYYPDLKIEKLKQSDGSKIYILTNKETKESFMFASRSLSWPAGYGVSEGVGT